jgi:hypothetical protein
MRGAGGRGAAWRGHTCVLHTEGVAQWLENHFESTIFVVLSRGSSLMWLTHTHTRSGPTTFCWLSRARQQI